MSIAWSLFIGIVTVATIVAMFWLLIGNRKISGGETTGHEFDGIEELNNPLPAWWIWLFVATLVFGIGYVIYYPALGSFGGIGDWTSKGQWEADSARHEARFAPLYEGLAALDDDALAADRTAQQVGRRLFINHCATCHGASAQGGAGFPNLTDDEWIWGGTMAAITQSITQGRTGAMPAWGNVIGKAGVDAVAEYVLSLSGAPHDDNQVAAGRQQFQTFCVACHQADGTGNPLLGAPNLTNDIWLYGSDRETIASVITDGRGGVMPAHRNILDAPKIRILASYVKGLGAQRTAP